MPHHGAAGGIGTRLRRLLKGVYPALRLSDTRKGRPILPPMRSSSLPTSREPAAVDRAVAGMQRIIHLGGVSVERPWDEILPANIVGIYNLFEAARKAGVERVVFASSNHILGFYPRHRRLGTAVIPRPDSRYGVSKVFGEALGALYADKYGLRVLTIRIGNVNDKPIDVRRLSIWILPEDLVQLIRIGLEHPRSALRGGLRRLRQCAGLVGQRDGLSPRAIGRPANPNAGAPPCAGRPGQAAA